ncbi:helix-turn-helix transcriptional regulator [Luteibacter flocculans]|uniref:Helix-turn-helix transcriptional regulator n=1 Tax=Luteibacter flocculans TaxID=2780091 RepID=A0ABY4TBT0_9GAMM|nr:helix-turn-helix transcriptional regulator [Luteibacter flocculans]URL60166.1 helix-turn-helix transcriptional regulator [Luteibacter flocculans]
MKQLSDFIGKRRVKTPSMDIFPMEVGRRLRLQRIAFRWRQSDLALRAGVSVQTIKTVEKGEAISSWNLLRILLALNQGSDFLKMLEAPNFPSLKAHEHYLQLTSVKGPSLLGRRVRTKAVTATQTPEKKA